MPRHDYYYDDDETMSRDRMTDRDYRDRGSDNRAMFRNEQQSRSDRMRDRSRERAPQYGGDAYSRGLAKEETRDLIASNKVEGTPVYDRSGDRFGSIHNFMVDKRKGKVVYAVLKHSGGFLGFDDRYYPLHWDELTYDTRLDGYRIDIDQDELKERGSFNSEGRWRSGMSRDDRGDREYERNRRSRW